MKKYIKITAAVLFIFTGILLFANIGNKKQADFKSMGVEAIATVKKIIKIVPEDEDDTLFSYLLDVEFYTVGTDAESTTFVKTSIPVKSKDLYKFREGYKQKIVYLKDDPNTAILPEYID